MNSAFDENCAPMNALAQRHRVLDWCANETRRSTMPFVICHLFFKEEKEEEEKRPEGDRFAVAVIAC